MKDSLIHGIKAEDNLKKISWKTSDKAVICEDLLKLLKILDT